jgi:hypothetical protein
MMNSFRLLVLALLLISQNLFAQTKTTKTEHVVLVTLDGLRWQELFRGADSLLVDDTGMVENPGSLLADFWHSDPQVRRTKLFPFVWGALAQQGQVYGNRSFGAKVDTQNKLWFSYPGYNELLSGSADDIRIRSNDKVPNPNKTFLEYLNEMPAYRNKVMAFGGWDVFPFIINETRSGIPVNAGFIPARGTSLSETEKLLNRLQEEIRGPWESVRLDPFTHHYALEAIRIQKPSILYLAYGETDDWAHDGKYDEYLKSAKQTDAYLKEIWETLQADPHYRNKTTMLITVDHGRGTSKESWKSHGADVPGAGQVWLIAIGPDTPSLGEIKQEGQWHSAMLPSTIFRLLGLDYPDGKAAPEWKEILGQTRLK